MKIYIMDNFQDISKPRHMKQVILGGIFAIYLVLGLKMPEFIANLIDTTYGKVIVIILALCLFVKSNPVLGVLGFLVAYNLLTQSSISTGSFGLSQYAPTEEKKYSALTEYNQFPYTLEQEVVKKMAPSSKFNTIDSKQYSFGPTLDDSYDAASIMDKGTLL
jgi:hypothetical protein